MPPQYRMLKLSDLKDQAVAAPRAWNDPASLNQRAEQSLTQKSQELSRLVKPTPKYRIRKLADIKSESATAAQNQPMRQALNLLSAIAVPPPQYTKHRLTNAISSTLQKPQNTKRGSEVPTPQNTKHRLLNAIGSAGATADYMDRKTLGQAQIQAMQDRLENWRFGLSDDLASARQMGQAMRSARDAMLEASFAPPMDRYGNFLPYAARIPELRRSGYTVPMSTVSAAGATPSVDHRLNDERSIQAKMTANFAARQRQQEAAYQQSIEDADARAMEVKNRLGLKITPVTNANRYAKDLSALAPDSRAYQDRIAALERWRADRAKKASEREAYHRMLAYQQSYM